MTLSVSDQLALLHDILTEHNEDRYGNVSEYQQIKRLVKSMMANNRITNEQLLELLPEIYHYGLQGESVQSMEEHITKNENNIDSWVNAIQQTTMK